MEKLKNTGGKRIERKKERNWNNNGGRTRERQK